MFHVTNLTPPGSECFPYAVWAQLMPDMAAGAASDSPVLAELSALVMRYVAEDVAVYNADIIGGRMKKLLFGLTSTLPQALPALYRVLEVSCLVSLFCRLFFLFFSRRVISARGGVAEPMGLRRSGIWVLGFPFCTMLYDTPMTKQPLRINHPNIPMWIYFLTLFTRRHVSFIRNYFLGVFFSPALLFLCCTFLSFSSHAMLSCR